MRLRRRGQRLTAVLTMLGATIASAQQPPPDLRAFLSTAIGLRADELGALERGEPVTRLLQTAEDRDVAIFGIVAVSAPRQTVAASLSEYPTALQAPGRTLGIMSEPAAPDDLAGFTLSARDARGLRKCRVGSCEVKLAAADMASVRAILEPTADSSAATLFERRRLANVANAYREHGNDALPVYDDFDGRSAQGAQAFAVLLSETPNLYGYAPGLAEYLVDYPRATLSGARDVLYWARDEASGVRPTTTINHRVVYTPTDLAGVTVAATKQILANHYLEASFEVLVVIDRPVAHGPGAYVMFLRRYRFDQMPQAFVFSLRGRVTSKLRDRARADLLRFRQITAP